MNFARFRALTLFYSISKDVDLKGRNELRPIQGIDTGFVYYFLFGNVYGRNELRPIQGIDTAFASSTVRLLFGL